ncbi:MAG: hypothetical protein OXF86_01390 [Caldilineaceae bacterium]|nr:hypothetical protein [Caldilineaceae bacterium]
MVAIAQHEHVEHAERISAIERELQTERPHLATKADVAEVKTEIEALKSWLIWRVLIGAAVVQGIIATLIKYLP